MNKKCKICSGPIVVLGDLGNRRHGTCRNCGMAWSWTRPARRKAAPAPSIAAKGNHE